jgi:hypothetical protein
MKKRFPLSLLVLGLLLIFILSLLWTNPAQGMPDPTKLRGHPWDHMLSPRVSDDQTVQLEVSIFMISFNLNTPMVISITKKLSSNEATSHSSSIPHNKKWVKSSKKALTR